MTRPDNGPNRQNDLNWRKVCGEEICMLFFINLLCFRFLQTLLFFGSSVRFGTSSFVILCFSIGSTRTGTKPRRGGLRIIVYQVSVKIFDPATETWALLGSSPACALAGPGVAPGANALFVAGGELKPGVRSPKIFALTW